MSVERLTTGPGEPGHPERLFALALRIALIAGAATAAYLALALFDRSAYAANRPAPPGPLGNAMDAGAAVPRSPAGSGPSAGDRTEDAGDAPQPPDAVVDPPQPSGDPAPPAVAGATTTPARLPIAGDLPRLGLAPTARAGEPRGPAAGESGGHGEAGSARGSRCPGEAGSARGSRGHAEAGSAGGSRGHAEAGPARGSRGPGEAESARGSRCPGEAGSARGSRGPGAPSGPGRPKPPKQTDVGVVESGQSGDVDPVEGSTEAPAGALPLPGAQTGPILVDRPAAGADLLDVVVDVGFDATEALIPRLTSSPPTPAQPGMSTLSLPAGPPPAAPAPLAHALAGSGDGAPAGSSQLQAALPAASPWRDDPLLISTSRLADAVHGGRSPAVPALPG